MKIVTIVGARPQFIKSAPVINSLRAAGHDEILVHTGQHYDAKMSELFFQEMGIPEPDINLNVGSGSHAEQTAAMLTGIEQILMKHQPDLLMVYGDTNSTLAGALAACKLQIPIAHVESGLRSYNRSMPEEHNRVLTDHCSDILFCPTKTAVQNLRQENIVSGVHLVGDTMYDAVLQFSAIARQRSDILSRLKLEPKGFYLATIHRPYNTDDPANISDIIFAFAALDKPVVFPVHPRTANRISATDAARITGNLRMIDPVGYLDMLMLEQHAAAILTDSGGVQKEAYFFDVPCVTLRPETEWVETVQTGWNILTGVDPNKIQDAIRLFAAYPPREDFTKVFGDGTAADKIVAQLS